MTERFNATLGRWTVYVDGRSKYRYRHRMEQHLGRELATSEHVHHLNGDPTDDRIENLQVLTASDHAKLHAPDRLAGQRAKRGDGWSPELPGCAECATTERPHMAHGLCGRCYSRVYQRATKGHAPRKPATVLSLVCAQCLAPFERTLHQGRTRYCSRGCASRASALRRWDRRRAGQTDAIGKKPSRGLKEARAAA